MHSPFLYFPGERLSVAELTAACLDGHAVDVGDGYMPADAVETPALRAGSLAPLLGRTLAATHVSAAWVYGAIAHPPERHTVQRAVGRRIHHVLSNRLVYRDGEVGNDDLALIGGVCVTSPARTLADLARVHEPAHREAARLLAALFPRARADAVTWFATSPPVPHKRDALRFLSALGEASSG